MTAMNKLLAAVTLVGLVLLGQGTAHAIPILQLYIEGAHYDLNTESWVAAPPGSSSGVPFVLWAIGNVDGPGGKGQISDVMLAVTYDEVFFGHITITLTPTVVSDEFQPRFGDPSIPVLDPPAIAGHPDGWIQEQQDGTILPKLSNGHDLPKHDAFGPDVSWQEFSLGDFTLPADSPIADFNQPDGFAGPDPFDITDIPDSDIGPGGLINAYEVSWEIEKGLGLPKLSLLHFDLYDNIQGTKAKFAPFSHNALADAHIIPEPASFIVWFLIGLSWAGSAWRCQYRRRWQKWQQEEAAAAAGSHGDDQAARLPGSPGEVQSQLDDQSAGSAATG